MGLPRWVEKKCDTCNEMKSIEYGCFKDANTCPECLANLAITLDRGAGIG